MPTKPNHWEFLRALSGETLTAMSGALSVPFSGLAVFIDNRYGQLLFTAMAFICVWYAAYRVWSIDRRRVNSLEHSGNRQALLDDISELREQLVRLRIDMQKDRMSIISKDTWEKKFKDIEAQISAKIEQLAGKAEATLYARRGNIARNYSDGQPQHQRIIDICIHDLDHLKEFIKDYSRGKR